MVGWETRVKAGKGRTALAVCLHVQSHGAVVLQDNSAKKGVPTLDNQKHSKFPKVPALGITAIVPEPSTPMKKPARGRHRSHASPFPRRKVVLVLWGGCTVTRAGLCHPSQFATGLGVGEQSGKRAAFSCAVIAGSTVDGTYKATRSVTGDN